MIAKTERLLREAIARRRGPILKSWRYSGDRFLFDTNKSLMTKFRVRSHCRVKFPCAFRNRWAAAAFTPQATNKKKTLWSANAARRANRGAEDTACSCCRK